MEQRIEFVDHLAVLASDPSAAKTLQGVRDRLAKRLAVLASEKGANGLTHRDFTPIGLRERPVERATPQSGRQAALASAANKRNAQAKAKTLRAPQRRSTALKWDAESKEIQAESGANEVVVKYAFTNITDSEVEIKLVRPSCGCTTLDLPKLPWKIAPGSGGEIAAKIDLRRKRRILSKTITVDSSSGYQTLFFKVHIPLALASESVDGEQIDPDRMENMKLAAVDRQVVFKDQKCAECHSKPAHGKMGEELFRAACAICHDTPHRATMVPDLAALKYPTNNRYWKYWIMNGRPGSLMPAFAQSHGGPLTPEQIDSVAAYLTETSSSSQDLRPPADGPQPKPKTSGDGS